MKKTLQSRSHLHSCLAMLASGIVALTMVAGCATGSSDFMTVPPAAKNSQRPVIPKASDTVPATTTPSAPTYVLRAGDTLKISFPGSPNLNSVQQIRSDGKITLSLGLGETDAAGLTVEALQKKLMNLYAPQLSSKEVTVEVQSSSFPVYVTGAVLHPGKITTDHPITALEAVMEAGGFDYTKANLRDVTVIRQEGDQTKKYTLDLKLVLEGKVSKPFYLKPGDIIYVPEKFVWF